MTERVKCKNPECANLILVSTAERTNGFCMPCVQAAARKERDEYIRKNRRDLDEFSGVTDPVEVLKIIHRPRDFDPLINRIPYKEPTDEIYTRLSREDALRLARHAESLVGTKRNDEAEDIIRCLAAFTDAPLEKCLRKILASGSVWPSMPFCRASRDIRDDLITRVEWDDVNRNHVLLALAWIGDAAVVDLFGRWRRKPPAWSKSLYIPPQDYAREAGWELAENGERRDLYFHECTKLVPGRPASPLVFKAITASADDCPWCGQRLTNLFELEPAEFGIFSSAKTWGRVQVITCETCTTFSTVFGAFYENGRGQWHGSNVRPQYHSKDPENCPRFPQNSLAPAGKRPALFAADEFLPTTFSQLGGHPTWIQDAEYPQCPSCSRTMMFLAQISCDEIDDYSEGIYYSFICDACRVTATTYQQT